MKCPEPKQASKQAMLACAADQNQAADVNTSPADWQPCQDTPCRMLRASESMCLAVCLDLLSVSRGLMVSASEVVVVAIGLM